MKSELKAAVIPAGETCLFVDFGEKIDLEINGRVQALKHRLQTKPFAGMRELVPTYRSLAVYFDPLTVELPALKTRLDDELTLLELSREKNSEKNSSAAEAVTEVHVPVCFGGEFGPDLGDVAKHTGLSQDEVVKRYCASPLYCFMNGFTPGFPYLGGMDPSLETPRLAVPRELIPANSVAIGGAQAGAYTIASPGGWRIIGRTPCDLYSPSRDPAAAIQAGMRVRFYPVDMERCKEIKEQSRAGLYKIEYIKYIKRDRRDGEMRQ